MPNEALKDGDIAFVGLNSRDNPSALSAGMVSRSQNFRLDRGVATTRKGLQRKTIGALVGQVIYGAGTYVLSSGQELIILVVANGIYTYNPQTETLSSKIYFPSFVSGGKALVSSNGVLCTVTSTAHGLQVGDPVYIETTASGYSGLQTVTSVTTNTFQFSLLAPALAGAVSTTCGYSHEELIITPDGCDVCAAVDSVFISRGFNKRPLKWDTATSIIALPSSSTSGHEFPNSSALMYYGNRIVSLGMYHSETNTDRQYDTVSIGNYLDWTHWDIADAYTINNGGNDQIMGISPWTLNEFLVFMRNSIFYVFVGNERYATGAPLSDTSYVKTLATDIGCSARKSVVQAGGGVFFLSDNGVYYLQPQPSSAESMKLLTMADPISAPIDDIIQRINRNYAHRSVATYWNNRYYLSVPLDDSIVNNTILVYNFILKNWESVDTYPTLVSTTTPFEDKTWTQGSHGAGIGFVISITCAFHGLALGDHINITFGQSYSGSTPINGHYDAGTFVVTNVAGYSDQYFSITLPWDDTIPNGYYPSGRCTFSKAESVSMKDFVVVKKDNQRRMYLVDNNQGLFLTEQLDWDEFGASLGNPILPSPLTSDSVSDIAIGKYGNLILVALFDNAGNPNANVITLNPLSFIKNDIKAILETRKYSFDGVGDKRFNAYEAEMLSVGGDYIETYAQLSNPDVTIKVDSLGSPSYEDFKRANPIRKYATGMIMKFISYAKRPSIRSVFVYANKQLRNNINKK